MAISIEAYKVLMHLAPYFILRRFMDTQRPLRRQRRTRWPAAAVHFPVVRHYRHATRARLLWLVTTTGVDVRHDIRRRRLWQAGDRTECTRVHTCTPTRAHSRVQSPLYATDFWSLYLEAVLLMTYILLRNIYNKWSGGACLLSTVSTHRYNL